MTEFRVRLDDASTRRLLGEAPTAMQRAVARWLPQAALQGGQRMRHHIHRLQSKNASGRMQKSVTWRVVAGRAEIEPEVPYAVHANYPTRAHVIEPRLKKALAFAPAGAKVRGATGFTFMFGGKSTTKRVSGGRDTKSRVVTRRVFHPGTRGLFFEQATTRDLDSSGDLERLLDVEVQAELGRIDPEGGRAR